MLDLRSYRSEQVQTTFPTPVPAYEAAVSDPSRTITGKQQLQWLKDSLDRIGPQWKVIGNPVMIAPVTFAGVPDQILGPINDVTGLLPEDGLPYNVDQWDGYTADRREVFKHIRNHQVGRRALRHRRHPLGLGVRAALRPGVLPASATRPASSSSAPR